MIRSNSIPSLKRSSVQPSMPLILCVPCVPYPRPSKDPQHQPTASTARSKFSESELNNLFSSSKTRIFEKSIVASTGSTLNSSCRLSYTTAQLNMFKNSLVRSNHKVKSIKLNKAESHTWSPQTSILNNSNMVNLNLNQIDSRNRNQKIIAFSKKSPKSSFQIRTYYDPIQYRNMVNARKAADFNLFKNKLLKNQPRLGQTSKFSQIYSMKKELTDRIDANSIKIGCKI